MIKLTNKSTKAQIAKKVAEDIAHFDGLYSRADADEQVLPIDPEGDFFCIEGFIKLVQGSIGFKVVSLYLPSGYDMDDDEAYPGDEVSDKYDDLLWKMVDHGWVITDRSDPLWDDESLALKAEPKNA